MDHERLASDIQNLKLAIYGTGNGSPGIKDRVLKAEWVLNQLEADKEKREVFYDRVKLLIIGQAIAMFVNIAGSLMAVFYLASNN